MAKAEWGLKRICPNCGTRYYDFRKDPPTCPACGTVYDPEALLKSRRARPGMAEELSENLAIRRLANKSMLDQAHDNDPHPEALADRLSANIKKLFELH